MSYETHDLVQGSPEWISHRDGCYNASDAGTALNVNPYKSRQELVRELASGATKEIDAGTQRRFDDGHRFERLARPLMEAIIGEELFTPTISMRVPALSRPLSASLDGATISDTVNGEHKTLSESLAAALDCGVIPEQYHPQMEQGMMINGATRCLFMASKWGNDDQLIEEKHAWYESNPALRAKIIPAWKQVEEDAANYQHVEVAAPAVATPTMQLPALSIQVTGSIALVDNLKVFGERLESFIANIDKNPSDDQAFADAEAAIKTLGTAETALEAAKASALAQTASIDEMTRTVALYAGQARSTRLMLEKLVKARKESIRVEIVQGGKDALAAHVAGLNKRLGKGYISADTIPVYFANVIKGKKTVASLRDAVDTELARVKIEANEIADRIGININTLREHAEAHKFLFADTAQIVFKQCDDFLALVKTRIADHAAAEEKRLEAEREKIRAEETAKLKREQERQARAEAERAEREQAENTRRLAAEARATESAAAQVPAAVTPRSELPSAPSPAAAAGTDYLRPEFDGPPIGGRGPSDDCPSSAAIVNAVAQSFGVSEETAYGWIVDTFSNQRRVA